jgi:ABC-type multidrug transport system fused ATPase/permease subunit
VTDLRQLAWLLRKYVAPHWPAVAVLLVTSYLATALTAAGPVVMAPILDLALGSAPGAAGAADGAGLSLKNLGAAFFRWLGIDAVEDRFRAILWLAAAYFALGLVKGVVDFGNYLLALWIRVRAGTALQLDLFRHLLGLSMSFFTRHRAGELVSRLDADTRGATSGLETIVITVLTAPVLIAIYGYLMVRTSPRLVGAALLAVLVHYGVTRLAKGPIRRLAHDQFAVFADLVSRLQEAIVSVRIIKSLGAEAFEVRRLAETLRRTLRVTMKFGISKHVEEPARAAANGFVEAMLIALAAWELLAGRLGTPAFFLFLYVGRVVMVQVGALGAAYTQMQGTLAAAGRVAALFAEAPAVKDGPIAIGSFTDRIALDRVGFGYADGLVFENVSFDVRRGELVALVGPSGVGKSTLIDLILRFHDPAAGRITCDGHELRTLAQSSYRRLFGVVSQEALLFNASVRDNIAYGREGLADADIVRAATIARAHEFVTGFADGYDTVVGDRGIRLSGGERQRIAIARAIVGRPAILVLDEATSALDSESERLVQEAIDSVIQGMTCIVIAHRLSTVLHADKIIVLGRGGVEAIGRHQELLVTSETYSRYHRLQFPVGESVGRL